MFIQRSALVWSLLYASACGDSSNHAEANEGETEGGVALDGGFVDGALEDGSAVSDGGTSSDAESEFDGGDALDGGPEAGAAHDGGDDSDTGVLPNMPRPDMENTGFLAYGQLRLAFKDPVDASGMSVTLSPARPADLLATDVQQAGANAVIVSLNTYHLPLDYTVTLNGPDYALDIVIPGEGNGSRTAFATRQRGVGDLRTWRAEAANATSGREAGDSICQAEAVAAGLKGTFRALLSADEGDELYDAACRALDRTGTWADHCGLAAPPSDSAPILDQDGLPLVNGATGIARAEWLVPMRHYADGERNGTNIHAWTGSTEDGRTTSADCLGFLSASPDDRGAASALVNSYLLNSQYRLNCASSLQLLCVQTGSGFFSEATLHRRTGKAVFITPSEMPSSGAGSLLERADAFCQEIAETAGYPAHENFVAWLTDDTDHAPCRLAASGGTQGDDQCGLEAWPATRWVRPDGYIVAEGVTELLSGRLRAPILLRPDGSRGGNADHVLTNTKNDGSPAATLCASGHVGSASAWSSYIGLCSSRLLICFER